MRAAVPGPEQCVSTWFSLVASGVDWAGQVASNDAQRKTAAAAQAPFFTCIYMRKNMEPRRKIGRQQNAQRFIEKPRDSRLFVVFMINRVFIRQYIKIAVKH